MTPIWGRHGETAVQAFAPGDFGQRPKRARRRLKTTPILRGEAGYALAILVCVAVWAIVVVLNLN